eukprot:m.35166 g.35166  ORF g.35166 m.35166 type:complete len:405 (+) comp9573_c0_seq1:61-1275(+)
MSVRRSLKNVVQNYSACERDVREATSNDPWGAPTSLLMKIADAALDLNKFSEIMGMIWKRLNDRGKYWRHVYKSLVLIEYLMKSGPEHTMQAVHANMYAIEALREFQFIDETGKDVGLNVRERAKAIIALLSDPERLQVERERAQTSRARLESGASASPADVHAAAPRAHDPVMLAPPGSAPPYGALQHNRQPSPQGSPRALPRMAHGAAVPPHPLEDRAMVMLAMDMSRHDASEANARAARLREEEELQLAIALSQSEAEAHAAGVPVDPHSHHTTSAPAAGAGVGTGGAPRRIQVRTQSEAAMANLWHGATAVVPLEPEEPAPAPASRAAPIPDSDAIWHGATAVVPLEPAAPAARGHPSPARSGPAATRAAPAVDDSDALWRGAAAVVPAGQGGAGTNPFF